MAIIVLIQVNYLNGTTEIKKIQCEELSIFR